MVPIGISLPQTKKEHEIAWDRMHVHHTQLQVLCCACHVIKTNQDREEKRKTAA